MVYESKTFPISLHPVDSKPFGLSYEEWTVKWWKWILEIPKYNNPLIDPDGKNAFMNQTYGKIFFLCQTLESSEKIPVRTISVPKETSIFMPIINWVSLLDEDGESDEDLLQVARQRMDVVKDLEIKINEIRLTTNFLKKFRVESPFVDVFLPENNILGLPSGKTRIVSDGYWIFTRPLTHNISVKSDGSCSSGLTRIKVNYNINII
jgi:hypothetical protein